MFKLQALLVIGLVMYCICILEASADCKLDDKTYKVGEGYKPETQCVQMTCKGDDQWESSGCPALIETDRQCTIVEEDVTKPYPRCCVKAYCKPY